MYLQYVGGDEIQLILDLAHTVTKRDPEFTCTCYLSAKINIISRHLIGPTHYDRLYVARRGL